MKTPEQIRAKREELMLTQKELAKILGVGQVTIARWENGNKKPHYSNLRKFMELTKKDCKKKLDVK